MSKFNAAVELVLKHEGSNFVNDPSDSGGPSRYGISLRFYKKNIKVDATAEDIKALTIQQAADIYEKYFWDRPQLKYINSQMIANRVFDLGVNAGPTNAIGLLQKAVNSTNNTEHLTVDGSLGPKTLAAINTADEPTLYNNLICEASRYYHEIAKHGNNQRFLNGWLNRLNSTDI